jgi:hypothetical protein
MLIPMTITITIISLSPELYRSIIIITLYLYYLSILTGGSLMTNSRVTQNLGKEKVRSNNSNDGNYLLLRGILSKLMSSNVL